MESVDVKLARIEEKLESLLDRFDGLETLVNKFATREELTAAEHRIENTIKGFVSKDEFGPVKIITFGMVGLIVITVLGAILNSVMG